MAIYKTNPVQLRAIQKAIQNIKEDASVNINYNLDYVKLFVHPTLNNEIALKSRLHGIKGGQPFDEINYVFYDEKGKIDEVHKSFYDRNGWYTFVSELHEIRIKDGHIELI
jgi:hypothetical protein